VSLRAWSAFAGVSILWGMPYLLIKVTVDDGLPPVFVTWVRVVLGAAVLLGISWRAGLLATLRGRSRWLATLALTHISTTTAAVGTQ
jgi:drug/metabolite transporter (DMT)-like permease